MTNPVAVSALFVRAGRVGGAEFMTYGLVEGLLSSGRTVALFAAAGEQLDASFTTRVRTSVASGALTIHPVPLTLNRFVSEAMSIPGLVRQAGARDLLLPNYFTPPIHRGIRTLSAILDLQYLHFPQFFSARKRLWLRMAHEMTLRRATRVSVISDFVRDDVLARYGAHFEHRISTIPIGISWERFDSSEHVAQITLSRPFILSVASHYSHKNLETLLRAFSNIAKDLPHDLVLVGQRRRHLVGVRDGGVVDLETLAAELGISGRVHMTGHATDAVVGWCYRNADVFVFPSLFEGFGMPAVEALGFGLPVITTKCGSLPEVTRGLAHLVEDPQDSAELASVLREAIAAPQRFRPSDAEVSALREYYAPARIARMYLTALDEARD